MTALLALRGFTVATATRRLLGPFDLELAAGGCTGLIGESGSGKSLTAQALIGLLPNGLRAGGELHFDGRVVPWAGREHIALRGRRVAWMPQDPQASLHPLRRVGDQLRESLSVLRGVSRAQAEKESRAWFERVELPDPERLLRAYPHELSGGQRQRVGLALALAGDPAVLVADEPTSALDPRLSREVLDLLARMRTERGLALLLVSHDLPLVGAYADHVAILRRGELVESGPVATVFAAPTQDYTRALLACESIAPPLATEPGPPRLEVRALTVRYPRATQPAVDGVDIDLAAGQCLALVGESGSGKTTVGRAVLRLLRGHVGGHLRVDGVDLAGLEGRALRTLRRRVGVVFQDPYASLDPRMTAADIVAEPLRIAGVPAAERRNAAARGLAEVDLDATALDRYPHAFSGGQRQRIAIARALVGDPALLVCDEAVSALDALQRAGILALLGRLKRERGLALLFITHDFAAARALAESVAVMQGGRIVEHGPTYRVLSAPAHPHTRALLAARPPPTRYLDRGIC
ncbi:MAG: ATP-binding cassette domain-containing protein [Arenimonas sp.]